MCTGTPSRKSDAELIQRLQQGDASAFDELFERHQRPLLAYAAGILRDRGLAEDVVQDAFLRLVRCREQLDPARGVSAWLYRVARNRAIDLARKRKHEVLDEDAGMVAETRGHRMSPHRPDLDMVAMEEARAVRAALETLPETERDVLQLRFFGDLAFREIAETVRRPLGTVLWQAHRGLGRLRELLGGPDGGAGDGSES